MRISDWGSGVCSSDLVSAVAFDHVANYFAGWQRHENQVRLLCNFFDCGRGDPKAGQALQGLRIAIVGNDADAAFSGQVPADRFAHDADADETYGVECWH